MLKHSLTPATMLKLLKWLVLFLGIWLFTLSVFIWQFGKLDQARPSDCIIVLGAAIAGTEPSPVFAERIRHAVYLYKQGFAKQLIFTGGIGQGQHYSESRIARHFAQQLAIPNTAILIEEHSRTTQENLVEAAKLMHAHGLTSAIIVSDPLHMKRALLMAHDQAISAVSSPTPSSQYRSWPKRLKFLGRELYFIHYYFLTGK